MRALRKYLLVALLSARSNVVYLSEVVGRLLFLGVILYIFSRLWIAVYSHAGSHQVADLSIVQMIWYLVATEAMMLSGPRVSAAVDLDVRSGTVVNYLQRPLSYPLYCLSHNLGERTVRFFINLLVGSIIAYVLVGPLALSWNSVAFFLLALPLAFAVDFLSGFLIGLGAFWFEDTSGMNLIYSRMTMIFGGMLFPLSIFPDNVRPVLEWLPFSAVVYGPAKLFVSPSVGEFLSILARQSLAVVVFAILVYWIYGRASKRVFVNGG